MLFNSLSFAAFFPVVCVLYYLLPEKFRVIFLLAASCVFYMAFVPKYILILFTLITLDYFLVQLIAKHTGKRRTTYLWISIAANIGMLFFFKYFNFFNMNVAALATFLHWNYAPALLTVALPIGLSFHIFQNMSYVIEVYRGKYTPERNYFVYALYVMFFPQLVAGPIERAAHLLPQFRMEHSFNSERVRRGLERMLWGFFKKLVIADNIAPIVTYIFNSSPTDGILIMAAAALFAYQIYCDFSGYSDIAVGTALVLGYDLVENFDRPYAARSLSDFWRRWHISLMNWLRDYIYFPLGGNRVAKWRHFLNIFAVFLFSGLWHGANWTYIAWGVLHGCYMVCGSFTASLRQKFAQHIGLIRLPRLYHALQIVITFSLVTIGWIFFRSENIHQAWGLVSHIGTHSSHIFDIQYLRYQVFTYHVFGASKQWIATIIFFIAVLEIVQYAQSKMGTLYIWTTKTNTIRLAWNYALLFVILAFGTFGAQTFIYFQF